MLFCSPNTVNAEGGDSCNEEEEEEDDEEAGNISEVTAIVLMAYFPAALEDTLAATAPVSNVAGPLPRRQAVANNC